MDTLTLNVSTKAMNSTSKPVHAAEHQVPTPVSVTESATRGPSVACLRSDALFGKAREILIEHSGSYYRLRVTHSNKLILTK